MGNWGFCEWKFFGKNSREVLSKFFHDRFVDLLKFSVV